MVDDLLTDFAILGNKFGEDICKQMEFHWEEDRMMKKGLLSSALEHDKSIW